MSHKLNSSFKDAIDGVKIGVAAGLIVGVLGPILWYLALAAMWHMMQVAQKFSEAGYPLF